MTARTLVIDYKEGTNVLFVQELGTIISKELELVNFVDNLKYTSEILSHLTSLFYDKKVSYTDVKFIISDSAKNRIDDLCEANRLLY